MLSFRFGPIRNTLWSQWVKWFSIGTQSTTLQKWSRWPMTPATCHQALSQVLTRCCRWQRNSLLSSCCGWGFVRWWNVETLSLVLQGRLFSYPDTHRHRLGANYLHIPVNCPYRARVANYQRDGPMCMSDNQGYKVWFLQIFKLSVVSLWGQNYIQSIAQWFPSSYCMCLLCLSSRWSSKLLSQQLQCPWDPASLCGIKVSGLPWCGPLQQFRWRQCYSGREKKKKKSISLFSHSFAGGFLWFPAGCPAAHHITVNLLLNIWRGGSRIQVLFVSFVVGSHLLHRGAQRRGAPETLPEHGRILEGGSALHPETHGESTHYQHTYDLHYFPIPQWRSTHVFIALEWWIKTLFIMQKSCTCCGLLFWVSCCRCCSCVCSFLSHFVWICICVRVISVHPDIIKFSFSVLWHFTSLFLVWAGWDLESSPSRLCQQGPDPSQQVEWGGREGQTHTRPALCCSFSVFLGSVVHLCQQEMLYCHFIFLCAFLSFSESKCARVHPHACIVQDVMG